MIYLLDTSVISDFISGEPATLKRFKSEQPNNLAVSTISLMEIEFELALNPERAKNIRPIIDAITQAVKILPFDENAALATASICAQLQDKMIGLIDLQLAGTAVSNNLIFVTPNTKALEHISGLRISWRASS